jgi:hypothetical protein
VDSRRRRACLTDGTCSGPCRTRRRCARAWSCGVHRRSPLLHPLGRCSIVRPSAGSTGRERRTWSSCARTWRRAAWRSARRTAVAAASWRSGAPGLSRMPSVSSWSSRGALTAWSGGCSAAVSRSPPRSRPPCSRWWGSTSGRWRRRGCASQLGRAARGRSPLRVPADRVALHLVGLRRAPPPGSPCRSPHPRWDPSTSSPPASPEPGPRWRSWSWAGGTRRAISRPTSPASG